MKFLGDAQLPRRLALWLQQRGHDVIHTLELGWVGLGAGGCIMQAAYHAL